MDSDEFKSMTQADTILQEMTGEKGLHQFYKTTTGIGAAMILTSVVLTLLNFPFAFDVTALAWGSIIIAMGLFFRHKENMLSIQLRKEYLLLEDEKDQRKYRLSLLDQVSSMLPTSDVSFDKIDALLKEKGDYLRLHGTDKDDPDYKKSNILQRQRE